MKTKFIAILAAASASLLTTAASAGVMLDSFSATPNVINTGDTVTFDVQISVTPDNGFFAAQFASGAVTINPGDGSPAVVLSIFNSPAFEDLLVSQGSIMSSKLYSFPAVSDLLALRLSTFRTKQVLAELELEQSR